MHNDSTQDSNITLYSTKKKEGEKNKRKLK
jgi:hypothetical protein